MTMVIPAKCAAGASCNGDSCCMGQKVSISVAASLEVNMLNDTEIKFPFMMKLFFYSSETLHNSVQILLTHLSYCCVSHILAALFAYRCIAHFILQFSIAVLYHPLRDV